MVRHGLMLVGEASCGKSCIIDGLKLAMSKFKDTANYNKVEVKKYYYNNNRLIS